jgi:hypothetical protein
LPTTTGKIVLSRETGFLCLKMPEILTIENFFKENVEKPNFNPIICQYIDE